MAPFSQEDVKALYSDVIKPLFNRVERLIIQFQQSGPQMWDIRYLNMNVTDVDYYSQQAKKLWRFWMNEAQKTSNEEIRAFAKWIENQNARSLAIKIAGCMKNISRQDWHELKQQVETVCNNDSHSKVLALMRLEEKDLIANPQKFTNDEQGKYEYFTSLLALEKQNKKSAKPNNGYTRFDGIKNHLDTLDQAGKPADLIGLIQYCGVTINER